MIESREKEVAINRTFLNYMTFNIFLFSLTPTSVSIVTIGFYQYFLSKLNITNMIMGITLFDMIQEPIRSIPISINCIYETVVSMRRIQVNMRDN